MKDHGRNLVAEPENGPEVSPARFHPATPRRSVGLVESLPDAGLLQTRREPSRLEEPVIDRPSTEEDLLQFFLAMESSRQEMDAYNSYLNNAVRQSAAARTEAEAATRMKTDFLATMSHEMRTPLNGIIGMTSVLLSRHLGELERDYVETIRQAGEALRAIVDDVLDLSKIDAGKMRLEQVDFEVTRTVTDALQILEGIASQKPLQFSVKHDRRLPKWVRGDASRIRQILLNLISNAIKFTDEGKIEIRSRVQFIDGDECELLFSVKDDGIGIGEEQQRKLFQPFSQAEDSNNRKYSGTGLGLTICKRLVELMGGQIGVTSRYGEGSLFWFTIRIQIGHAPPIAQEPEYIVPVSHLPRENARILLVEDNKINQKVAVLMLKDLGYTVDVANNGEDALHALDEKVYDLILMDCMMPEMDGIEATRRLRGQGGAGSRIPVIAMTASAFDDDRVACLSAGMNDFISKPVDGEELEAKLAFWLSHRHQAVKVEEDLS